MIPGPASSSAESRVTVTVAAVAACRGIQLGGPGGKVTPPGSGGLGHRHRRGSLAAGSGWPLAVHLKFRVPGAMKFASFRRGSAAPSPGPTAALTQPASGSLPVTQAAAAARASEPGSPGIRVYDQLQVKPGPGPGPPASGPAGWPGPARSVTPGPPGRPARPIVTDSDRDPDSRLSDRDQCRSSGNPMRFESHFKSYFGNVKAFNFKKLKLSLSPSPQWPQAALRLGGDGRRD